MSSRPPIEPKLYEALRLYFCVRREGLTPKQRRRWDGVDNWMSGKEAATRAFFENAPGFFEPCLAAAVAVGRTTRDAATELDTRMRLRTETLDDRLVFNETVRTMRMLIMAELEPLIAAWEGQYDDEFAKLDDDAPEDRGEYRLVPVGVVAKFMDCDESTVRRLVAEGQLGHGGHGQVRISMERMRRFLARNLPPKAPPPTDEQIMELLASRAGLIEKRSKDRINA